MDPSPSRLRFPAAAQVLITGFDPFGEHAENSSQLVLKSLTQEHYWPTELLDTGFLDTGLLRTVLLPTSYRRARTAMLKLLAEWQPTIILHMGLASQTQQLRFEEVARNRDESTARDNDHERRSGQPISPSAPKLYSSGLPLAELHRIAASRGESVLVSTDCGGFVCNHIFYCTSHYLSSHQSHGKVGFVHLPSLTPNSARLSRLSGIIADWLSGMLRNS